MIESPLFIILAIFIYELGIFIESRDSEKPDNTTVVDGKRMDDYGTG